MANNNPCVLILGSSISSIHEFEESLQKSEDKSVSISFLRATNLVEGIALLDNAKLNAVVSETDLEDSKGIDTVVALYKHANLNKIPIIVLSDKENKEMASLCLQYGAQDYIVKRQIPTAEIFVKVLSYASERYAHQLSLQKLQKEFDNKAKSARELNNNIINSMRDGVVLVDCTCNIVFVNEAVKNLLKYSEDEILNSNVYMIFEKINSLSLIKFLHKICSGKDEELNLIDKNGLSIKTWLRGSRIRDAHGSISSFILTIVDIREWDAIREENRTIQYQLQHALKMESIGNLAAGVAHEINTPAQYISDNLSFLKKNIVNIKKYISCADKLLAYSNNTGGDVLTQKNQCYKDEDIEYLLDEIPIAINQSIEGVQSITSIVSAMKDFSHPGQDQGSYYNINEAINSVAVLSRNQWKYIADVKLDLSDEVDQLFGHPELIKQALLNMIINSTHSISEKFCESESKGLIKITTNKLASGITLCIEDNGAGIPDKNKDKIFNLFFTTKDVGVGTGQGLNMVYKTIVDIHKGKIDVESALGEYTKFNILLSDCSKHISHDQKESKLGMIDY